MIRLAVCVFALSLGGCSDDSSGPVLRSGPWYGYFADDGNKLRGAFTADVSVDGKIQLHVRGKLADEMTPLDIEASTAILREGSNFFISGTQGNRSVSGYGRERVFDTTLECLIPVPNDCAPEHQLHVGNDLWNFSIFAGANRDQVVGAWSVRGVTTHELNSGMFMAQPGDLPPPDALDLDAPVDAPVDAGANDGGGGG